MALLSRHALCQVILSVNQRHQLSSSSLLWSVLHKHSRIHCKWFQVFPQVSSSAALRKGWHGQVWSLFSDYHIYCISLHSYGACPEQLFPFHSNYTCRCRLAFSHISGCISSIFITAMSVALTCTFKVQFYSKNATILSLQIWHFQP